MLREKLQADPGFSASNCTLTIWAPAFKGLYTMVQQEIAWAQQHTQAAHFCFTTGMESKEYNRITLAQQRTQAAHCCFTAEMERKGYDRIAWAKQCTQAYFCLISIIICRHGEQHKAQVAIL